MQGVVIQGPTKFYKEIVDHYKDVPNVVWSTWHDEPLENLSYIGKHMPYILNKQPKYHGYLNVNLQALTTYSGIKYLIDEGATEILKIRGDVKISNIDKLLKILKGRKMSFLQMCKPEARKEIYYELIYPHFSHDYPADIVMYGDADILLNGFDFEIEIPVAIPPESLIAYHILKHMNIEFKLEYDHLTQNGITFFLQDCLNNDIDFLWLKNGLSISEGTKDKNFYEY
jgi:hypothetical protein